MIIWENNWRELRRRFKDWRSKFDLMWNIGKR
jgi:hypothetical protein